MKKIVVENAILGDCADRHRENHVQIVIRKGVADSKKLVT